MSKIKQFNPETEKWEIVHTDTNIKCPKCGNDSVFIPRVPDPPYVCRQCYNSFY